MTRVQERRVDSHRQATIDSLGGADQLQPEPQLARVLEVVGLDVLDPVISNLVDVHRRVERQPGEDRHLCGGIRSIDILGWIRFGISQPLGL
jgi:hypothetical protein